MKSGNFNIRHQNAQTVTYSMVTMDNKTFKINIPIWPVSALNDAGESTNSTQVSARQTSSASVAMNAANAAGQLQISWPADHTGWQFAIANEQPHQRPGHELDQRARFGSDQPDDCAAGLNERLGILPVGAALLAARTN
jgi:hypothetical protein